MKMLKNYPLELLEIMIQLSSKSNNNFLVGGCVRDLLLDKNPHDFDIVTDIPIDTIIEMFKENGWKINEAGKQFLVLILSKNGQQFEIANYRNDGTYIDGRRPESVNIATIDEDAMRRDISINSLYYNPFNGDIVDPTNNGLDDIKNKVIRMNGRAEHRIKEDLLRIIRVYRFSNQLGFTIDKKTLVACRRNFNDMIAKTPGERIKNEIEKMCNL